MVGHVARTGKRRGSYRILLGTSKEKRALGRPRRRWEDNINIDIKGIGWVWTGFIWLRIVISRVLL